MIQPPPLVQEAQRLQQLGQEIVVGAHERLPELQARAASQMSHVLGMRDALIARLARCGPTQQEQLADGLAGVEQAFQAYLAALDALDACCAEPSLDELEPCLQSLPHGAEDVYRSTCWLEDSILSLGPSRFPEVNLATNLVVGLRDGSELRTAFEEKAGAFRRFYQGMVDELSAQPQSLPAGIAERKDAAVALTRAWDRCLKLTASSAPAAVEAALDELSKGHLELENAQRLFLAATFGESPTGLKEANWIIHAGRGVIAKRYPISVLRPFVLDLLARTRNALPELEAAVNGETDETLLAATEDAMTATITVEGCLSQLDEETQLDEPSAERMGAQLVELEQAVTWLVKASATLKECDRIRLQVCCPRCQTYNPSDRRTCESCQATLPHIAGLEIAVSVGILEGSELTAGGPRGPLITRPLVDLNQLVIAFERGQVSADQLVARLVPYEETLAKAEQGATKLKIPLIPERASGEEREKAQGFVDLAGEALALVLGGAQLCRVGLDEMRAGALAKDRAALRDGYRSYFEGIQEMSRAGSLPEILDRLLQTELAHQRELEDPRAKGSPGQAGAPTADAESLDEEERPGLL
jgi:hypothetical protein